ncbi:PAS domain S-box protein [Ideonella sp. 4Y11]|uniref:histidine kinase n=1 Tax=Ideonella aquatica TaxID=2824119 RepID=A0A941BKG0_9BURK|nr:PAS domain S-box protein [Ideonella aquatica]MBQ0959863.1 PAS domain S-box protein [Ideonella aquatica]
MDPSFSADTIVDRTPHALVAVDASGSVRFWNAGAEALYGHPRHEALGRHWADLFGEPPPGGLAATVEVVRRCRDGALIYVESCQRPLPDPCGEPAGCLCSDVDVTPWRVRREADLVEALYGRLLESMPDAIIVTDRIGRIILANGQAQRMFGRQRTSLLGDVIESLMPARSRGTHVGQRDAYLASPRTRAMGQGLSLQGLRASGEEFPVEISLSPLDSDLGPLAMAAIRDVSDRHRVERALQEKNVELERASRAKDRFLATMSHELRTPLNAILGFTGLLLMRLSGPLNAEQERQLGLVNTSGKHLLSLINDLLDLAKIDSGRVEIQREPVDCRALIEDVIETLRQAADAKGLRLLLQPTPDLDATLHTDRRALQQVLINLVNNAIKFTDTGSVELCVTRESGWLALCVTDTGRGISEEDQARLFQPFVQVGGRSGLVEGTGLGLHLSLRLAELLGGRLVMSSTPQAGSRFTLSLPLPLHNGDAPGS